MSSNLNYPRLESKSVLVVENECDMLERLALNLERVGCEVTRATNVVTAEKYLEERRTHFDLAIVDMYIPEDEKREYDRIMRGEQLAYTIQKRSPKTRIVGISEYIARKPFTPFCDLFSGFVFKKDIPNTEPPVLLLETLDGILSSPGERKPRMFIVHGHDNEALLELSDFLQNTLKIGLPTVLRNQPSCGRTVIEKFEREAADIDLVFVLLTPDDTVCSSPREKARRARQNVIFEMGFFFAKLQRTSGRVFVLKKAELEMPSDISGLVYIDISKGVGNASKDIRAELKHLGWI